MKSCTSTACYRESVGKGVNCVSPEGSGSSLMGRFRALWNCFFLEKVMRLGVDTWVVKVDGQQVIDKQFFRSPMIKNHHRLINSKPANACP